MIFLGTAIAIHLRPVAAPQMTGLVIPLLCTFYCLHKKPKIMEMKPGFLERLRGLVHPFFALTTPLILSLVGLPNICFSAAPQILKDANYSVYSTDINGDGCPDYLIKAPNAIAVLYLDEDFLIPVAIPSQNKAILVMSNGTCSNLVATAPTNQQINSSAWVQSTYTAIAGDVLGNGNGSILLAPTTSDATTTISLTRNPIDGTYSVLQVLSIAGFGVGTGAVITLEDANADSRTDLIVRNGFNVVAVFTAGPDGKFTSGTSDLVALVTVVWNNFSAALRSTKPSDALQMVSTSTRSLFESVINAPGADTTQFADSVLRFDVLDISDPGIVMAAIVTNDDARATMYYVYFEKDADGYWKIYSL